MEWLIIVFILNYLLFLAIYWFVVNVVMFLYESGNRFYKIKRKKNFKNVFLKIGHTDTHKSKRTIT